MGITEFRAKMRAAVPMAGTFVKTASYEIVEVLAKSGLDFICLDAEHAPFDRARLDACLGMARALDFPTLVRVADGSPREILQALDMGAVGIVVPHVDSEHKAAEIARAARFGHGGRGYAGSTRWAGFATRAMPEVLAQSQSETVVIAQIEEPEGVEAAEAIAAVQGIDGVFIGPADLSVGYGKSSQDSPELMSALERVGHAAQVAGKTYMTFVPNVEKAQEWRRFGLTMFFIGSEHSWMLAKAKEQAAGIHAMRD